MLQDILNDYYAEYNRLNKDYEKLFKRYLMSLNNAKSTLNEPESKSKKTGYSYHVVFNGPDGYNIQEYGKTDTLDSLTDIVNELLVKLNREENIECPFGSDDQSCDQSDDVNDSDISDNFSNIMNTNNELQRKVANLEEKMEKIVNILEKNVLTNDSK